jgi:21S rRNA (uridine2791-2'-O)-methyltransferase
MQGNFMFKSTQERIKAYLSDPMRGRHITHDAMIGEEINYIDMAERDGSTEDISDEGPKGLIDVITSDMSEPWPQTSGFWKFSHAEALFRMTNVSGLAVRDHGDSMVCQRGFIH